MSPNHPTPAKTKKIVNKSYSILMDPFKRAAGSNLPCFIKNSKTQNYPTDKKKD